MTRGGVTQPSAWYESSVEVEDSDAEHGRVVGARYTRVTNLLQGHIMAYSADDRRHHKRN